MGKTQAIRLHDAADLWLQWARGNLAETTTKQAKWSLGVMKEHFGRNVWLSECTAGAIGRAFSDPEGAVLARRDGSKKPKKPASINITRTHWKMFFEFCGKNQWSMAAEPMALARPRKAIRRTDHLYLSQNEMLAAVDYPAFDPHRVMLALQAHQGNRVNEAMRIRIADLLVQAGYIRTLISKTGDMAMKPVPLRLQNILDLWLPHYAGMIGRVGPAPDDAAMTFKDESGEPAGWLMPDDALTPAIEFHHLPGDGTWQGRAAGYGIPDPKKIMTNGSDAAKAALRGIGYDVEGEASHCLRRSSARILFDYLSGLPGWSSARVLAAVMAFGCWTEQKTCLTYIGKGPGESALAEALSTGDMYGATPSGGGIVVADQLAARRARQHPGARSAALER